MDPLDLKILRTMGVRPYGPKPSDPDGLSFASVAKAIGVEPETVRARGDTPARQQQASIERRVAKPRPFQTPLPWRAILK